MKLPSTRSPPVLVTKTIATPDNFTFRELYGKEGRYLQTFSRQCGTSFEFDPVSKTIKVFGSFEGVQNLAPLLTKYISTTTQQHSKKESRRKESYYIILCDSDSAIVWTQYIGDQLPYGLQRVPYVMMKVDGMSPRHEEAEVNGADKTPRKMGLKIDSADRCDAAVRAFSMLLFSEAFAVEQVVENAGERFKKPCLRFSVGKLLLFDQRSAPDGPSNSGDIVMSIPELRSLDEGVGKDFRTLFLPAVDLRTVRMLHVRILERGFKHSASRDCLKVRLCDRVDKSYVTAKFVLNADGSDLRLHSMVPSFAKFDSLVLISSAGEREPDVRLRVHCQEYYGPNHPSSLYAWAFASRLSWNEADKRLTVSPKYSHSSRFEINMWQRVRRRSFENPSKAFRVHISDILEDDGKAHVEFTGSPLHLNTLLRDGHNVKPDSVLQVVEVLKSLIG